MTALISSPVWQVAAGTTNRPYADLLFKHGVALIGPGDSGPWTPAKDANKNLDGAIERFARGPQVGHPIALTIGEKTLVGVGVVAEGYQYLDQFDDVEGWDLQHALRVRWFKLPEPHDFEGKKFGRRFSQVGDAEVIDYAMAIVNSSLSTWKTADLPPLPELEPEVADLPPMLASLVGEVQDLLRFYWGPGYPDSLPSEDETVALVVVPFLKALGWRGEHVGIKWRDIDVTLFRERPRTPENVQLIVEAKRLGSGLEGALRQAKGYAKKLGVLRDILVTDGVRYRLYAVDKGYSQVAYANLYRPKMRALALFERLACPSKP